MSPKQLLVPADSTIVVRVGPPPGSALAEAAVRSNEGAPTTWTDAELRAGRSQRIGAGERLVIELRISNPTKVAVETTVEVTLTRPDGESVVPPEVSHYRLEPGGWHQVTIDIQAGPTAEAVVPRMVGREPRKEMSEAAPGPQGGSRGAGGGRSGPAGPGSGGGGRGGPAGPRKKAPTAAPPEPVLLGVSAPRAVKPGTQFVARFAAYIKDREDAIKKRLESLSRDPGGVQLGFTPNDGARWRVGTPVAVRVSGDGFVVEPSQTRFEWSGQENLLSFVVKASADLAEGFSVLTFEASIAGVPVALIPLELEVGSTPDARPRQATAIPARTAFASYASADRLRVMDKLGALSGYDPTLDIFTDCLDLRPGQDWQERLEVEIPGRDIFLLFWSQAAAASKWVGWEWQKALDKKGIAGIHPMPLEAPQVAPPPPELSSLHFNDRYLMVRAAELARQAPKPGG